VATENLPPDSSTVNREAFVEDVLKSIKHPPEGMTAQEVRDRLLADLLYRLSSAESMVGQIVEKIQSGGIGAIIGGMFGKAKPGS